MSTAARPRSTRPVAPSSHRRLSAALLAAGVATFAELYAVQSVLPQLAREWALAPSDAALAVSAATLGLALSVLPWAGVAERIGRLRAMRIAVLTSVVVALLACVAPSFEFLLVLRLVGGAALGAVPALAVAAIHDRAPVRRPRRPPTSPGQPSAELPGAFSPVLSHRRSAGAARL